jgi:ornithine cyclodeaminase/alanine dehydrogenase-like protein (mu-crystallin family)
MAAAIDALQFAFGQDRTPESLMRTHVEVADGTLLLMPAATEAGVGVKLVTVNPANPARGLPFIHATYVLFAPGTLEPVALIEGAALTALRTAAVSGLATRHLARKDAHRLVVFGAGVQATAHLEAMLAVRPVDQVRVVGRTQSGVRRLVELARSHGVAAHGAGPEAVADADLVCTCTTSDEPVFVGLLLPPGVHINAVGSFQPTARELDDEAVRMSKIVVEVREAALAEAGDLLIPMGKGVIGESDIAADLGEVVRGTVVRRSPDDVTLFKSVGVAFEDLVVAAAAFERLGRR